MAMQVATEPVQTLATEEGTSSVRKGGDPPGSVLTTVVWQISIPILSAKKRR